MSYTIVKCRLCPATFKQYSKPVVKGDNTCCLKCNDEASKNEKGYETKPTKATFVS